jgi:hypothetical protein
MQTVHDLLTALREFDIKDEIAPPKDGMIYKFVRVNSKPYIYLVPVFKEGK